MLCLTSAIMHQADMQSYVATNTAPIDQSRALIAADPDLPPPPLAGLVRKQQPQVGGGIYMSGYRRVGLQDRPHRSTCDTTCKCIKL